MDADNSSGANENQFHLMMLAFVAVLAMCAPVLSKTFRLELDLNILEPTAKLLLFTLAPAILYCQWAKRFRVRDGLLLFAWMNILGTLLMLPIYAAARMTWPLRDRTLAAIDRAMDLNVGMFVAIGTHHAWIGTFFAFVYDLLIPMVMAASVVPILFGRFKAAKEYIVASSFACIGVAPIFALLPAVGPWSVYAMNATPEQRECEATLLALRDAGKYVVNLADSGVICFPSFHVVLAILAARALWSIGVLRPFAALLCGLVIVSTLMTGWHYGIDVIGGLVFAIASIAVSIAFTSWEVQRKRIAAEVECAEAVLV